MPLKQLIIPLLHMQRLNFLHLNCTNRNHYYRRSNKTFERNLNCLASPLQSHTNYRFCKLTETPQQSIASSVLSQSYQLHDTKYMHHQYFLRLTNYMHHKYFHTLTNYLTPYYCSDAIDWVHWFVFLNGSDRFL